MKLILVKRTLVLFSLLGMSLIAYAQNVNIPDANFKAALLAHDPVIDSNDDDEISFSEADAVTEMDVHNMSISSLVGIEAFTNLTHLVAWANSIETVDFNSNTNLIYLQMNVNDLISIDVTMLTELEFLGLGGNALPEVDVSQNTKLTELYVQGNFFLDDINISGLTDLETFWFASNPITSIDLSNNTKLQRVKGDYTQISAIDVSMLPELSYLQVQNTQLTSLDLTSNSNLTEIYAINLSQLITLKLANGNNTNMVVGDVRVSNVPNLTCISVDDPDYAEVTWDTYFDVPVTPTKYCDLSDPVYVPDANFKAALLAHDPVIDTNDDDEIQVSEAEAFDGLLNVPRLDISDATGLEAFINIKKLDISNNSGLNTLDVSANTKLTFLKSAILPITTIDLSQNTMLDTLYHFSCELSSINLSNNTALIIVDLRDNQLTSLDVTNNIAIKSLLFGQNNITTFNYPAALNTSLEGLGYGDNPLANKFDFTVFPNLKDLRCNGSELTSLDVSMLSDLERLTCSNNPITNLDLSQNTSLTTLGAGGTLIEHLDLSQNTEMTNLFLSTNELFHDYLSAIWTINLANGNNDKMEFFFLGDNFDLECIQVDNPSNPFPNLSSSNFDGFSNFSDNCISSADIVDIPDAALKELLLGTVDGQIIDANDDDRITFTEALSFTGDLELISSNVTDMTGIEAFENMESLSIRFTTINILDVSSLVNLKHFEFSRGAEGIMEVDLSNNLMLEDIVLKNLSMSSFDPTVYPNLTVLTYQNCGLSSIDLTQNPSLERLGLRENNLTQIDLSQNTLLTSLNLALNPLNSVNITDLINLEYFDASETNFTEIDLSMLVNLKSISMEKSNVISIDLSNSPLIEVIDIDIDSDDIFDGVIGKLEEITFPSNPTNLKTVNLRGNKIQSIDISAIRFNLFPNGLSAVNLKDNDLQEINIGKVFSLVLTGNPNLTCAQTTDITYAIDHYSFDDGLFFNTEACATPTDIILSSASFDENSVSAVGTFITADESENDVHEYTFFEDGTETNNTLFKIIDDELFPKTAFDFENENEPTYLIQVQSDDGFGGIINKQLTITLNDINEAPTNIQLSNKSIDESNPVGTLIGVLSTEDVDNGDTHTYTVVDGCNVCRAEESSHFEIVGNELRSKVVFDFETLDGFGIDITSTDAGGLSTSRNFVVIINDLPASVTAVTLDNSTIDENLPASTLVGTLSTSGEDLSGNFTYVLVSGAGSDDNTSFSISENELRTTESFNHEVKNSYSILVQTDDGNGHTLNQQLTISVGNVSESTDTHILTFVLAEQTGDALIDNINNTVAVEVARGTDLTSLTPVITLSAGASITPTGARDFSNAVTYTVTAEEPTSIEEWQVTVTEARKTETDILTFELTEQTGEATIDATNHTVTIEVANGTDLTSLIPTVTLSAGAAVSPEGAQDFTNPVTYSVTAEDGTTTQDWVVTATAEPTEVTAIDDNEYKVSVYPNPTSDWLTIVSPHASTSDIQLFDLGGGLMFTQKVKERTRISLQDLETGLYLLKLTNKDITTTTKILIQR